MNKESANQTNCGMNDENGGAVVTGCSVGVVAGVGRSDINMDRRQHHHGVLCRVLLVVVVLDR